MAQKWEMQFWLCTMCRFQIRHSRGWLPLSGSAVVQNSSAIVYSARLTSVYKVYMLMLFWTDASVLHAVFCMLHAACCVLHAACGCMLHATCRMLHAACRMLCAACCMLSPKNPTRAISDSPFPWVESHFMKFDEIDESS